jgi:hypothetical protein
VLWARWLGERVTGIEMGESGERESLGEIVKRVSGTEEREKKKIYIYIYIYIILMEGRMGEV